MSLSVKNWEHHDNAEVIARLHLNAVTISCFFTKVVMYKAQYLSNSLIFREIVFCEAIFATHHYFIIIILLKRRVNITMKQTNQLNRKRFLSLLLTLVLISSVVFTAPTVQAESLSNASVTAESSTPERIRDGVILHAFDWNLNVIEQNLQAIADAGYTAIQTSPIMGVGSGAQWYAAYQPRNMVAGGEDNRYGDRDAFVSLTSAAEKLGIKVIVDVVPNHMGSTSNSHAPWNDNTHFHDVSGNVGYNDRFLLTQPEMISGLRDLDTHSSFVQESIIAYLKDMIDAGASGFRYDAIKHIELDDDVPSPASISAGLTNNRYPNGEFKSDYVKNVTGAAKAYFEEKGKENFQYGEVLQGGDPNNDRVAGYAKYIDLTASMYGHHVRGVLEVGDIGRLDKWTDYAAEGLKAEQLVPWVESHDTYNNEGESLGFSPKQIRQGWAMIAARKDASPLFFARNINASGNQIISVRTADNVDNNRPQWSHPEVVTINKFHNAMAGRDENLVSLGNNAVMIERGTIADGGGAVLLNTSTTDRVLGSVPVNFLKDGYYVNALDQTNVFTVSNGRISGIIPGNSANINNIDTNTNPGLVVLMERDNANPTILAALPSNDDVIAGNHFTSNQLQLRMSAVNVTNAMYAINNGDAVEFEDDEIIIVDANYNGPITVTLVGQVVGGQWITREFTYNWIESEEVVAPPIEEPTHVNVYLSINHNTDFQAWSNNSLGIRVYTFNPELFGGWPGGTMTRMKYNGVDTHWYKIVMPRAAVGGIIFNNQNGQQTGQPAISASMLNNEQLYFYGTGASNFGINTGANWDTAFAAGNNIGFAASNVFPPGRNGVIFNTSGGSSVNNQYVREGEKATRPATDPTRSGYLFDGKWYTDSNFENEYNFDTPVVSNLGGDHIYALTLYAGWIELEDDKFLVEFDAQGGSSVMSIPNVVGDTSITAPEQSVRNGYAFAGWFHDSDYENEWNFDSDTVKAPTKLFAKWEIVSYNIIYMDGGAIANMPGSVPDNYNVETETFSLSTPSPKDGYTFNGWFTDPQFLPSSKLNSVAVNSVGDLILYARFTANTYSITLDPQSGLGGTAIVTVMYGGKLPLGITRPEKSGYSFRGYYADTDGEGQQYYNSNGVREFKGEWSTASGSTFYAHWIPTAGNPDISSVAAALEALEVGYVAGNNADNVTQNVTLPTAGIEDVTVSWSSDNAEILSTSGVVVRPLAGSADAIITLTATLTKGQVTDTKSFTVIVRSLENGVIPSPSYPEPTPAPTDVIKDGNKAIVELGRGITSKSILVQDIAGLSLQIKATDVVLTVQADALKQWLTAAGNPSGASLEVTIAPVTAGDIANTPAKGGQAHVEVAGVIYDITIKLKHNNQVTDISNVGGGVEISLPYNNGADEDLLGIYYYNAGSKEWEYVGGSVDATKNTVTVTLEHLSNYAVLEYSKSFTDVPSNHWVARTLEVLAAKHIIKGTSDTHFTPNGHTTRAEFTSLLVRALGLTQAASLVPFEDVQAGQWYANEVAIAYEAGLVTGVSDTTFDPNAKITREQMAVLLVRAYEYNKNGIVAAGQETANLKDGSSISLWAVEGVNKAITVGLLQGKGNGIFDPASHANRAETAQAILNLLNKL